MINVTAKLILFFFILTFLSCNDCNLADCKPNGRFINLRLMKAGKNAVFGPDAFIELDSIFYYSGSFSEGSATYHAFANEDGQSITLFLEDYSQYMIDLGSFGTDTFAAKILIINHEDCCPVYGMESLYWNGDKVCDHDCGSVVEVEL